MSEKTERLGICDLCKGAIRPAFWYTSKGKPRRYCSRDCRNTANSRAGAAIRATKQKDRVAAGEWQNPHILRPPTPAEQSHRAALGRRREVEAGTWRNPALTDEARAKLSKPRKHSGALAGAIEKLGAGAKLADLTIEEQDAHRAYRREQQKRRWESMTEDQRNSRREQWRRSWHKRQGKADKP